MEQYIPISYINDFLYSPSSLYLHMVYDQFSELLFHDTPQKKGLINHKAIDAKRFSTKRDVMQGAFVYSDKYKILGKVDVYDRSTKTLTERKSKIKTIYDGYKYQLYAQYFCLQEMGETIEKLELYSIEDNKKYNIPLPSRKDIEKFEKIVSEIKNFDPLKKPDIVCDKNANISIYKNLCW